MAVALALVAAVLFAFATVLQQKAGMQEGTGGSASGLLLRMARRPVWLGGVLADAFGYLAQAVALGVGRLAVVQPVLVSTVVFALPLGARFTGQRVRAVDVGAALVVTAGLVVFLIVADPSGGRDNAPAGEWLLAGGVIGILTVPLTLIARALAPAPRAALLGTAAGMLFGLTAALTKAVVDRLDDGVLDLLVNWEVYALIVIGYVAMTFNQLALSTGALAPAVATGLAFNPITSVVLGTTLLQESLHESTIGVIATVLALAAALVGMVILARSQSGPATGTTAPAQARR